MTTRKVSWGDVLLVALPANVPRGREQEGLRPAVVVGIPPQPVRYPVLIVAPLTSQRGQWSEANPRLYPALGPGVAGLRVASTVLVDQLRACDVTRMRGLIGELDASAADQVRGALRAALGLGSSRG